MKSGAFRAAAFAAVFAVAILAACTGEDGSEIQKPKEEARAQSFTSLTMEGVTKAKGGKWILTASSASADSAGKVGKLTGISASMTDGEGEIMVTAQSCAFESETMVKLEGGVETLWGDYMAKGSEFSFDLKEGKLTTSQKIELAGKGIKVTGNSLDLDARGRAAKITGNVKAVIGKGVK